MSKIRKIYFVRLILRIIIFIASFVLLLVYPKQFDIVNGWNFFKEFSIFHLLWVVWMFDMVKQLTVVEDIALGSQKIFKKKFRPEFRKLLDWDKLKDYIVKINKAASRVMLLWAGLIFSSSLENTGKSRPSDMSYPLLFQHLSVLRKAHISTDTAPLHM